MINSIIITSEGTIGTMKLPEYLKCNTWLQEYDWKRLMTFGEDEASVCIPMNISTLGLLRRRVTYSWTDHVCAEPCKPCSDGKGLQRRLERDR